MREDNCNNKDEVALVGSTKKGGKKSSGGDKPQRENLNMRPAIIAIKKDTSRALTGPSILTRSQSQ